MNAQQLRNSILQMAIQGKLVQQDPSDEPASVLLKRIRQEKEQLIKAGKIKRDKHESVICRKDSSYYEVVDGVENCIDEEVPFDIPENWVWVRFSSVMVLKSGQDMSPDKYNDNFKGIPYITGASNIEDGKIIINRWTECGKSFAHKGDILLTCKGTVGTLAILNEPKVHIARQIMAISPSGELNRRYILLVLDSFVSKLKHAAKSMIPGISREDVLAGFVPIPPIQEQHRIVEKIEELLPFAEKYGESEELLNKIQSDFPDRLKKSILKLAVQGKLVPQDPSDEPASVLLERIHKEKEQLIKAGKIKRDKHESVICRKGSSYYETVDGVEKCIDDEIPFDIPDNWEWCRFKAFLNIVSARRVHQSDWRSKGIPFYRSREIAKLAEDGYVDNQLFISPELYEEYAKSGVPTAGDLMVTAVGTLGKTYIVKPSDRFYYKDASVLCFENFGKINSSFLRIIMQSPFMESAIKEGSSGTTVGTITIIRANEYLVPLPPLAEQQRIVEKVEEVLPLLKSL